MKKMLLLVIVVGVASFAWSQASVTSKRAMDFPTNFSHHTLKNTWIDSNFNGGSLPPATYTAVDGGGFLVCPGTSGSCLIQATSWVQSGNESVFDNPVAIGLFVDGVGPVVGYFSGQVPTGFFFTSTSTTVETSVTFGSHFVQTFVYAGSGANTIGYYDNTYRVYKP